MVRPPHLLGAISSHGFGHLSQVAPVVNRLHELIPQLKITVRAVYTVKFDAAVYVLHVFQKKSKRGAETPMPDISLINARLKKAEEHHKESNS